MPFPFVYLCDLLDKLERPYLRDAPLLPHHLKEYTQKEVISWFQRHRDRLNQFSTNGNAVIMMLQPERWSDRDFGWNIDVLEHLIARSLSLSKTKYAELRKWRCEPHSGDLAACVEQVMDGIERIAVRADANLVTVEEVDQFLLGTASHNHGSSADIRALSARSYNHDPIAGLGDFYQRLQGREAKWLTRIFLKTTDPVKFPTDFGVRSNQSHLPNCVQVHVEFPGFASSTLQMGQSGSYKGSQAKDEPLTWVQPSSSSPLEAALRPFHPRIRDYPDHQSKKRRVSRPSLPKEPTIQLIPTPKPPKASSITASSHSSPPPNKRRRLSREPSSGPIVFQRGILQPLRPTDISGNLSQTSSISSRSPTAKHPKALCQEITEEQKTTSYSSRVKTLTTKSSARFNSKLSGSTQRVPDGTPKSFWLTPRKETSIPFPSQLKATLKGNPIIISPALSPKPLRMPPYKGLVLQDDPPRRRAPKSGDSTRSPNNAATKAHVSVKSIQDSTAILPSSEVASTPQISTSSSASPMITAGTGQCQITPNICPLTNCIFLLDPCIPSTPYLLETVLSCHGVRYITSISNLSHPSIPRRCPRTSKKYRKIVLVEPNFTQDTVDFLKQIDKLDLKRSRGRKQWVEVYDWRLLDYITKVDQGKRSLLASNPWKKFWMCAV